MTNSSWLYLMSNHGKIDSKINRITMGNNIYTRKMENT